MAANGKSARSDHDEPSPAAASASFAQFWPSSHEPGTSSHEPGTSAHEPAAFEDGPDGKFMIGAEGFKEVTAKLDNKEPTRTIEWVPTPQQIQDAAHQWMQRHRKKIAPYMQRGPVTETQQDDQQAYKAIATYYQCRAERSAIVDAVAEWHAARANKLYKRVITATRRAEAFIQTVAEIEDIQESMSASPDKKIQAVWMIEQVNDAIPFWANVMPLQ